MKITHIVELDKKKCKIFLSSEDSFVLYRGEVRRFDIEEGAVLSQEVWEEIVEVLIKRAKARSLYLLKSADKTEFQLRSKLKEGGYPPFVIDEAIAYVERFHYIDDTRFTDWYVRQNQQKKSKRHLRYELEHKGVAREIIDEVLEDNETDELEIIKNLMKKKCRNKDMNSDKERRKVLQYFCSRGFSYENVRTVMREFTVELFEEI